ncbi:hypothetical protein FO519_002557 [Halicephalobus sp. NKZ332]|nr:hypothetical protein FO519_002557 [Halicephalobus sp. NKZ332]
MELNEVLNIFMKINGGISTALNVVLIYMIIFKSPEEIKKYKWFLLNNAIWDLLFNIVVSYLFAPEPLLADLAGALVVTSGMSILGFQYAKWITMMTNALRPTITEEIFVAFDISENHWLIIAVIWAAGGVGMMTTINFSCTILILRKLNSIKIQLSAKTYRMHKQYVIALVCQTVCPILALIVPFSGMVFSSALKVQLPFGPNWFIFISTLNAVLNPVFTLYFVKAYWYQIFPKKTTEPEATTTTHSTQTPRTGIQTTLSKILRRNGPSTGT